MYPYCLIVYVGPDVIWCGVLRSPVEAPVE